MAPSWNGNHNGQVKLGGPGHWWATNAFDYSLDVITLLAVIGEQSMSHHSQVINVHWSCLLPRLLPAPQAFLKPNRPNSLPHIDVTVIGVDNGAKFESISLFADSLLEHSLHDLKQYTFHVIQITKVNTKKDQRKLLKKVASASLNSNSKPKNPNQNLEDVELTASKKSPLVWLAYFSCFMSLVILSAALWIHDGMGVIAITILSLASSLIGIASKWDPKLTTLPENFEDKKLPKSDIILQTRAGAFVLVKCDERISRELFAGTNECIYEIKSTKAYRVLMSLATVFIMISVIFLGNCRWEIKAAIGGCYILLNLFYWVADMYKPTTFWDLSGYKTTFVPSSERDWEKRTAEFTDIEKDDAKIKEKREELEEICKWVENDEDPCFTKVVWQAIYSSRSTTWAESVLPGHRGWKMWLEEAKGKLGKSGRSWKAVKAKNDVFANLQGAPKEQIDSQTTTSPTAESLTTNLPKTECSLTEYPTTGSPKTDSSTTDARRRADTPMSK